MKERQLREIAEKFAERFLEELHQESPVEQKCEWTCSLWLKEYYGSEARKSQIRLQQANEYLGEASVKSSVEFPDSG